jgi:hypothetical protein
VTAGDDITVVEQATGSVSVADLFAAVTVRPQLLAGLVDVPGLKPWIHERAVAAASH